MEQITIQEISDRKLFKENAVWLGTYLGGPLAAGYLFAENFKSFGEPEKAKKALNYGVLSTIILLISLHFIPDRFIDKVPHFLIPLVYSVIAKYIFQRQQLTKATEYISNGGQVFSLWRAFAIGLIGAAITLILVFGVAYLSVLTEETVTALKIYSKDITKILA